MACRRRRSWRLRVGFGKLYRGMRLLLQVGSDMCPSAAACSLYGKVLHATPVPICTLAALDGGC